MPTFTNEAFQSFIGSFKQAFAFIIEALHGLIEVIKSNPLYFVPLFLVALLAVAFWVGWLIMEVAPNAPGTSYGNPYGYFANPNKQFDTKMPNVTSLGRRLLSKRKQEQIQAQKEISRQTNQRLADNFFKVNPKMSFYKTSSGQVFYNRNFLAKKNGYKGSSSRRIDPRISVEVDDDD